MKLAIVSELTNDLNSIVRSAWKWYVLVMLAFVYCLTLKGLVKAPHTPLKAHLLIGQELVGRVSPEIDSGIPLLSPRGYDSQFFWALSLDPLLQNDKIKSSIDAPLYRSQRILLPLLTWCLIRDPTHILYGLWFWSFLGYLLGLIGVYRLCLHFKISIILPLLFYAFNPGVLIALLYPMSDTLAFGLFLFGLSCWIRDKYYVAMIFFALACVAREFIAIYIFFIAIHQIVIMKKIDVKHLLPLALSGLPMILWQIGIKLNLGDWGYSGSGGNFDFPFLGTIKAWHTNWSNTRSLRDVIGASCIHTLCVLMIYKGFALLKNLLWFLVTMSAALMCVSGEVIMESDWSYMRVTILLVTLMIMVLLVDIPSDQPPKQLKINA